MYICDKNIDEDPEIRVSVKEEGEIVKNMKKAMNLKKKWLTLERVKAWVDFGDEDPLFNMVL